MRRTLQLIPFAILFVLSARAQPQAPAAVAHQVLGADRPYILLTGPWKFHLGDDPHWADPGFDDSSWENIDLTPPSASVDLAGDADIISGWAKAHPASTGYAWYRLRVDVPPGQKDLFLSAPQHFEDAYQLFSNGTLIGSYSFPKNHPVASFESPRLFSLPPAQPGKPLVLALRFWMAPTTLALAPDDGGMHDPPILGHQRIVSAIFQSASTTQFRPFLPRIVAACFLLAFALLALLLYWLDRSQKVLLWMILVCLVGAANYAFLPLSYAFAYRPQFLITTIGSLLITCYLLLWLLTWWNWFELRDLKWIRTATFIVAAIWIVGLDALNSPIFGDRIFQLMRPLARLVGTAVVSSYLLLLGVTVFNGIRRRGREGWLTLPAVLLYGSGFFIGLLPIPQSWRPNGIVADLQYLSDLILIFSLTILVLRRFQKSQKDQEQLQAEAKQAQEVQRVLVPEAVANVPGFAIESEYRPARVVGGDFFQILPISGQGTLIVIGDVAGKGMAAAMLVAVIVGSIRTAAQVDSDPQFLLNSLNEHLYARMRSGFATCLAMYISADGSVIAANAGHLSPYLDGVEVPLEPGLPLGITLDTAYKSSQFQIPPGARLTLVSDGVVEARTSRGELFGFERTANISRMSASDIAGAAIDFGQDDDITVLALIRHAASVKTLTAV